MHKMGEFVLVCSCFHGVAQAGYHSKKRSLSQFWNMTSKVKVTTELLAFWVLCSFSTWRWPHLLAAPVVFLSMHRISEEGSPGGRM